MCTYESNKPISKFRRPMTKEMVYETWELLGTMSWELGTKRLGTGDRSWPGMAVAQEAGIKVYQLSEIMLGVKFATAVAAVGNAWDMVEELWLARNNKSQMLLQFLVTEWATEEVG
ncbi:GD20389 [Drosophila simulans]|uniref:GD20389 n=1 Tax=Drosophila simulans TaxID=7240 RepID=B4QZ63_DROSI|nr:GD20389 [Drosophila simulans]